MKKTLKNVSMLAAMLASCAAANAQGTISSIGLVSDKLCFSVGEVVVGERAGFWTVDATLEAGVKGVFSKSDIGIKTFADSGDIEISLPQSKAGASVVYTIHSINGTLLRREKISAERTVINKEALKAAGTVILSVSEGGKRLASVKLIIK